MTRPPIRVLIVDDEALARDAVRLLVAEHDDLVVVDECTNGREAASRLQAGDVDLVLLDVQMPGMTGLEVIREVGVDAMPTTIFVTAYDEHAIAAFDVEALDYLLKPIDDHRFATAIARARRRLADSDAQETARQLAALLARSDERENTGDRWLVVRTPGRVVRLREQDIEWIEAADYCVRLHVGDRAHLVRASMAAMEQRIDQERFVRIHRSTIVNVDHVREIQPLEHGDFLAVLGTGARLRVSRTRRRALEAAFGPSI